MAVWLDGKLTTALTQTQNAELLKIDSAATDGLSGTSNSLAYRENEIERHLHSAGSWFGVAAVPTATHKADRIGPGISAFQLDAGNETWGDWVQVFGADDTPTTDRHGGASAYFDPHIILITDAEAAVPYFIQFSRGATGAAGLAAGTYTELAIGIDVANRPFSTETKVQTGRAPSGALLWARCLAVGQNTATLDFYIGIHEYEG